MWFRDALASQPQAAEVIIEWVNSYLVHTQSGLFLGIGLLFMLYTVLMLVNNIEQSFNEIWQVANTRSIYRSFTNYLAAFFLFPIFIILTTGLSVMITTMVSVIPDVLMLSSLMMMLLDLSPYLLLSAFFIGLYISMPNTHVDWRCAIVPGIVAGIAMQWLQIFYVHSQLWVTGYNAIYGSFAALPLFMLWVQISWTICLFGAELTYTNQQMKRLGINIEKPDMHPYVELSDDELSQEAIGHYADTIDEL